jgi:segregation and condensation protein B
MDGTNMKYIIEALLIATDTPLSLKKLIEITQLSEDEIKKCIDELNQEYCISNRSFEIKEIAGGYQIYTLPEFALWVGALHDRKSKLSKAALETAAIIAYHQPITRPEVEKIRGVDSSWVLDTLLQKGLIKTVGRLPVPGRPIKYATTKEFLRYFGIKDLSDLPQEEDFGERVAHYAEEEKTKSEIEESEDKKDEEVDEEIIETQNGNAEEESVS